ncbi:transcriptional repressor of the SOS regulon [Bdellovibrio bacteriovorus W]|nr:transcriptional repressor of the SOS regulon [Bdellovibrio bacteriovorus W]
MVELRPANSEMSSMWYEPEDVAIRGRVVGLIRKF